MSILLVDDDAEIRQLVCDYLARYGICAQAVAGVDAARRALAAGGFDLVLLDIMLPDGDGLALCRELAAGERVPIILLTALADESDRVLGLEMGADDYLTKPFSSRELLARIRAVLRRSAEHLWVHRAHRSNTLSFAGWTLSVSRRELVNADGVLVALTGGEFDLLLALASHAGQVLSRDQLLELTKGRGAQAFDRSIDVQLSRLRKKLDGDVLIKTVRGGGYQFVAEVARDPSDPS